MFKLRIKVFLALVAGIMLLVAGKLVILQIVQGEDFREKAEEAMQRVRTLPVMRGQITDREGRILAMDEPCFDFCLNYRFLTADEKWIKKQVRQLARRNKIPADEARAVYEDLARQTWSQAKDLARRSGVDLDEEVRRIIQRVEAVRRSVNRDRADAISVDDEDQDHPVVAGLDEAVAMEVKAEAGEMVGATVVPSSKRWYPHGAEACHVIGLTGKVWPEETEKLNLKEDEAPELTRRRTNYLPGDTIGKTGVEKMCEPYLRGRRGYRRYRLSGQTLEEQPTVQGGDVHLTIDIALHKRVAALFAEQHFTGAAVVIALGTPQSPRSDVLALVSVPTYDLNTYARDYPKLLADQIGLPLMNRPIVQCYQPGSTVKPIAALAALADRKIGLGTPIDCKGYLYNPDSFRCWIWKSAHVGHGPLTVEEAIQHSCNVFFYEMGNRVGAPRLCEWFALMGLADKPGMGLPSERPGTVPTEAWLAKHLKRNYQPGDARFMAVGQGLVLATPVHMANAIATIARDGVFLSPTISLEGAPPQVRRKLPLSAAHLQAVREGMRRVVNDRQGTAYKYFHGPEATPLEGIELCGKTGTATTAPQRIDTNENGRIDLSDEIVRQGDTAWFVGFAPFNNPQIAVAVTVEYVGAGGGGGNAGPIAREIVRTCQQLGYVR